MEKDYDQRRFLGMTRKEIYDLFAILNKILSKEERELVNKFHSVLYGLITGLDDSLAFKSLIEDARKKSSEFKDMICSIPWLESTQAYDQEIRFHRENQKKLIPARKWEKYRYDFTQGQINGYVLKRKENGLDKYILRISNRLYIDSVGFDEWLNFHREKKEYPKFEKPVGIPQQPKKGLDQSLKKT